MTASHNHGPVSRHEMGYKVGAYDELHHAHGYRWAPEKHHWYWFVGLGATCLGLLAIPLFYWMTATASAPFCSKSVWQVKTSPNGTYQVELAEVSCFGAPSEQQVMIAKDGDKTRVIASYSLDAKIYLRWRADDELVVRRIGGDIWLVNTHWNQVAIRNE